MTTELIPVFRGQINGIFVQLVDARTLHAFLEVNRDFSTWIKNRISEYSFTENQDYLLHKNMNPFNSKARAGFNKIDYHLSLEMAKELAMVERTEKGRQIRRYFIELEREVHNKYLTEALQLPTPPTKFTKNVKTAINSRAHSLSLKQFEYIKNQLQAAVENCDDNLTEQGLIDFVWSIGLPNSKQLIIHQDDLWAITSRMNGIKIMTEHAEKAIHHLEEITDRQWYGRGTQ